MKNAVSSLSLACAFALCGPSNLSAQDAPATAKPQIKFSETIFDFGKVKPTDTAKHEFIVTNTGNALLEITLVQPGCGCTTAGEWDKKIEPGMTGKIPIQFSPANFSGPVSKSVTVTCNDPAQGTHYLQIQATVWRPIEVQPSYAYFMPVQGEETNETKIVKIINNLDETITLQPPVSASPLFKTELKTIKPGKEFELHITYSGPVSNAPPQGNISITTSATGMPALSVNAVAMIQPPVSVFPTPLQLPATHGKTDYQAAITVRNNSRTPMKLSNPVINAEGAKVAIQNADPGKVAVLNVTIPASIQIGPNRSLELTVQTENPRHPVIKVPIVQPAAITPPPAPSGGAAK